MSDRLFGGFFLVVALWFAWGATRIETGLIMDPLGPRTFPVIIAAVLGIASLYPILRPDPEPAWPDRRGALEIALAVVLLVAYALVLVPLGFVVATALATLVLSWRLGARPVTALAIGVGVSLGIYTVFHLVLGLALARGPLGI